MRQWVKLPTELEPYVRERLGGEEQLERYLEEMRAEAGNLPRSEPPRGTLTWPADASEDAREKVSLVCLLDEAGRVEATEALSGSEPSRAAPLSDAKKLVFPPLAWNGRRLRTVCAVTFSYKPGRKIEARPSDIRSGEETLHFYLPFPVLPTQ